MLQTAKPRRRRRKAVATSDSVDPLAAEIGALRARLKLSQGDFASKIGGVTQQTVSDWERGRRLRQLEIAFRLFALLRLPGDASR